MNIEWFRDLVICIFGIIGMIALTLISVIALLFYNKANKVMDSIQHTADSFRGDLINPLVQIMAAVQGIRQVTSLINNFINK